MKVRNFIMTLAVAMCSVTAHAQSVTNTVYLKNGSVIHCAIVEQDPGKSIKVRTKDGNIFVYQMDEVERIAQKEADAQDLSKSLQMQKHRGLDWGINLGPLFGVDKGGSTTFNADLEVGRKFNKSFYFGVSGGVTTGSGYTSFPVLARTKIFLPMEKTTVTPSIGLGAGYTIYGSKMQSSGAFTVEVMPGIQFPINPNVDLNCGVGYIGCFSDGTSINSIGIRLGFGLHKATGTTPVKKPKKPTRENGLQYMLELGSRGYGGGLLYKINNKFSAGVGFRDFLWVELEPSSCTTTSKYMDEFESFDFEYVSPFIRGTYRITNRCFSPIVNLDLGVNFVSADDLDKKNIENFGSTFNSTTFFVTPSVGFSWRVKSNSYIEGKVGYEICTQPVSDGENPKTGCSVHMGNAGSLMASLSFVHTLKWLSTK